MRWTLTNARRLAAAASLGLPLAIVALVKALGAGPLASVAAVVEEAQDAEASVAEASRPTPPVVLEPLLTLPQGAEAAWKRADELRRAASPLLSPFYEPPAEAQAPPEERPLTAPPPPPIPSFVLSGVMNARPPIAVIDGEIRRAGEAIGKGWSVVEIDARRLCVTIRHEDGRTHELSARP
ncbi:MAG: hypothetical protein KJZ69_03350 [Phycisphaerales bacterium]|nr:hypothetical protein [Phycisphaerales bacterium]